MYVLRTIEEHSNLFMLMFPLRTVLIFLLFMHTKYFIILVYSLFKINSCNTSNQEC